MIMKTEIIKKAAALYRTATYCMARAELYLNEVKNSTSK